MLQDLFNKLSLNDVNYSNNLDDILSEVKSLNDETFQHELTPSGLKQFFEAWWHMNEESRTKARLILHSMFDNHSTLYFMSGFIVEIVFGLSTCDDDVKEALLKEVKLVVTRDKELMRSLSMEHRHSLVKAVVQCIFQPNFAVSEAAHNTVLAFASYPEGMASIFEHKPTVELLRSMLKQDESLRMRLYDLCSALACMSEEGLKCCVSEGFMEALYDELGKPDLLVQLNVLEILTKMVSSSEHCLKYFHNLGAVSKLHEMMITAENSSDAGLLHYSLVRFFGHLARLYPTECCNAYPGFLPLIFHYISQYNSLDAGLRLLTFDTFGMLGSTAEGKRLLTEHEEPMKLCMRSFGAAIRSGTLEIRARHIEALTNLFTVQGLEEVNEFTLQMHRWFKWLADDSLQFLFALLKQPFAITQEALMHLLIVLADHKWFVVDVANSEGILDFLVARPPELSTAAVHLRYDLIQALSSSSKRENVFNSQQQLKIMKYLREGIFYIPKEELEIEAVAR
ncbi:26S proteasome non-ATPase regulatory subunit 5 [Trichinella pseudospiralis]|uniref:26S proteasome non-ATPase regulatory subunit 5 n=2 Tax=Trichinella pseudospiralis TaxID=6337 RepID=A0A0V1IB81_TRIPS|nr:26S proteasome non-ATPase regulatory subunit 5 [Trichinella pseudospiralis]KRY81821.1 26S proteasome non-ATPase regulatory subunit 5 [Trichinella pseudospiralis]KRZ19700.1 26S proteasome non-ATPase regulatory subunit 5 [Trichinella pseudospiralis]